MGDDWTGDIDTTSPYAGDSDPSGGGEDAAPYSDPWLEQQAQTEDHRAQLMQNLADANQAIADDPDADADVAGKHSADAQASRDVADHRRFQAALYRAAESDPNAPAPEPADTTPVWEIEAGGSGDGGS